MAHYNDSDLEVSRAGAIIHALQQCGNNGHLVATTLNDKLNLEVDELLHISPGMMMAIFQAAYDQSALLTLPLKSHAVLTQKLLQHAQFYVKSSNAEMFLTLFDINANILMDANPEETTAEAIHRYNQEMLFNINLSLPSINAHTKSDIINDALAMHLAKKFIIKEARFPDILKITIREENTSLAKAFYTLTGTDVYDNTLGAASFGIDNDTVAKLELWAMQKKEAAETKQNTGYDFVV